jgi:hypothetical protein
MGIQLAAIKHDCGETFASGNSPSWTIVPGPGHGTIIYSCTKCGRIIGVAPAPA